MEELTNNNNYLPAGAISGNSGHHHYHTIPLHYQGHNAVSPVVAGRFSNLLVQPASNLAPVAEDLTSTGQVLTGSIAMDESQVDDSPVFVDGQLDTPVLSEEIVYNSASINTERVHQDPFSMYLTQRLRGRLQPYGQMPSYRAGYPPGSINYTMPHPTGPGAVSSTMSQPSGMNYTMSHQAGPLGGISYPSMSNTSGLYLMQNELTNCSQSASRYSSPCLQPTVVGISMPTRNIVCTSPSNYMFTPNIPNTETRFSNLNWMNSRKAAGNLHQQDVSFLNSNEAESNFGMELKMPVTYLQCGDVTSVIRNQPLSVSDVVAASLSLSSLRSSSTPVPWQHTVPKRMPWITTLCTTSPPVFSGAALDSPPSATSSYSKKKKVPTATLR